MSIYDEVTDLIGVNWRPLPMPSHAVTQKPRYRISSGQQNMPHYKDNGKPDVRYDNIIAARWQFAPPADNVNASKSSDVRRHFQHKQIHRYFVF